VHDEFGRGLVYREEFNFGAARTTMPLRLSDIDITKLIDERKPLPANYHAPHILKPKHGHKEYELAVKGEEGSSFRLILRQSSFNALDFSAILAYDIPDSNMAFRLRRYNGRSHEHTNHLEGETFYDFHIHCATERYQCFGMEKEDAYAEPTNRYADLIGALDCLLSDCHFHRPVSRQRDFLEGTH
jgi:hypothetical protein